MPELGALLCLIGLGFFGTMGVKGLISDRKRDAEVRAHIFRRMGG